MPAFSAHHWYAILSSPLCSHLPMSLVLSPPPHQTLRTIRLDANLPPLLSPICSRIGDKRCVAMEHYVECPLHPGSYHVKHGACIKCTAALKRREREAQRNTKEHDKENQQLDGDDDNSLNQCTRKKKKKPKKPSASNLKSQKQLRREAKAARKSLASTCTNKASTEDPAENICRK